jgi:hypothetical protein
VTDSPPAPGHDQIIVTGPAARAVCHSREHARLGVLAGVVVTIGALGTAAWDKDAVWPDTWGHSYPMCHECWDHTRHVAKRHRPGLVITDTQPPGPSTHPAR